MFEQSLNLKQIRVELQEKMSNQLNTFCLHILKDATHAYMYVQS